MTAVKQGRLVGKIAIVVGAWQQPGQTPGNNRAVAERYAQEGATQLLVDVNAQWAQDTLDAVKALGDESTRSAIKPMTTGLMTEV